LTRIRVVALCLLLAASACSRQKLEIPEAEVSVDDLPEPADTQPNSYVSAPIVFDYRPLIEELEQRIPRVIGSVDKEQRKLVVQSPKVWVAAELTRSPLAFDFNGNTVTVSTSFEYRANAWVKPLLIVQHVSCGMGDERPRLNLTVSSTYDVTPSWHLKTKTRLVKFDRPTKTERDQCEISFLHIDVTDKVISAVSGVLEKELAKLDTTIGKISIQKPVDELWDKLQTPISIAKGQLWFRIRPQEVALGPITATDSTLTARLDLQAKPRIRAGERPPNDTVPLPPLGRTKAVIDTADVLIEGTLYYAAANKVLEKRVTGKSIGSGWRRVKIESIVARPGGQGRMLLGVTISGAADGTVYVVGTPHYDSVAKLITVPDLAFDVKSQGYLESAAGWLINGPLLDEVRDEAKLPVQDLLDELVQIVNKEINRPLAEGIYLRGALSDAHALSVRAVQRGVIVDAKGLGRLWLEIEKKDLLPKKRLIKQPKKALADKAPAGKAPADSSKKK
jgi:hypothetical protein